jgi:phosphosulfolactate synthase (CoM biosynthesis protein A)
LDLTRIDANRKESRATAFKDSKPRLSFDSFSGTLKMVVQYAESMGTQGQYDYTIKLPPTDFAAILKAVSLERSAFEASELQAA